MNKCIYTNKDDSNATFKSAEHVFHKCIVGQYFLQRGFVSDQINNEFSRRINAQAAENVRMFVQTCKKNAISAANARFIVPLTQ